MSSNPNMARRELDRGPGEEENFPPPPNGEEIQFDDSEQQSERQEEIVAESEARQTSAHEN